MSNRLAKETSPYLLQHAENPVDWYPWAEEAFARARAEEKPILLSIGYSACHWCHVMAHESFEDDATARLLNERFVCVKVDREEMPDVDQIYQQALQLQGEHGGWPLTMFLTPDRVPFFGGTYFPKQDRFGRPAFARLVVALADAFRDKREQVLATAGQYLDGLHHLSSHARSVPAIEPLADTVDRAAVRLSMRLDMVHGGFEGAPKFPNPSALELLLRGARRAAASPDAAQDGEPDVLRKGVALTLLRMAEGGIYDQLGGGFHRYSTDERWLVPHFEKMLYDNGQLLCLYAEAWQLTREATFARVVRETAAYLERDLRAPEGGFYAAQDADSEGVEGKYYVWTPAEVRDLVGAEAAEIFCHVYGVTPGGNWNDPHGHGPVDASILSVIDRPRDQREVDLLAEAKIKLLGARARRVPPGLDDKVLASSNGIAIGGLAEAGRILGDEGLVAAASRAATFVLERMVDRASGRMYRTFKAGAARFPGTLDDHAFVACGLIALYEATGEGRWLEAAHQLTALSIRLFYDERERAFFVTAASDPGLIERPVSQHDGAIPSGMSVCLANLIRLGDASGEARWTEIAETVIAAHRQRALENPFAFANLLGVMDLLQERPAEIVLAGGETAALERAVADVYLPNRLIVRAANPPAPIKALVAGKQPVGGKAAAYVCRNFACEQPEADPAALRRALEPRARRP